MKHASAAARASTAGTVSRDAAARVAFLEPVGRVDDVLEGEADRMADAVARGAADWSLVSGGFHDEHVKIRRAPKEEAAAAPVAAPIAESAGPSAAGNTAPQLLAEDDAEPVQGQMRKSEFMTALRTEVCATVDEALAGTGRDSQGCPWVDLWIGYYAERSVSEIERAIRRYAPEAGAVKDALGYIRAATVRVRRSADIWAKTGQITGVPEDVPPSPMAGGKAAGEFGGMFFKARPGGARAANPGSVRDALGAGRMLPGDVRSRMESAFGTSFAEVRVHADVTGGQISDQLNARAFAVGRHVAFAPGEFRPGTMAGDALIAHELAHVVQQGQASAPGASLAEAHPTPSLEDDADAASVRVLSSLWGGARQLAGNAGPRLASGLRLQRCDTKSEGPIAVKRMEQARKNFRDENKALGDAKLDKIDKALAIATKGNLNLLIRYYDYYSNHELLEKLPLTSRELATTKSNDDTKLRMDVLTPGFSDSTLGSTLIHELVHTRHDTNIMGSRDYQEGEAYGVEYVIAQRAGDQARVTAIEGVMGNPKSIAMAQQVPALILEFKVAYGAMTVLYEVIDKGAATLAIPALTTPKSLTTDEARAMVTQLIASRGRDQRLAELLTWIKANLASFTFPI